MKAFRKHLFFRDYGNFLFKERMGGTEMEMLTSLSNLFSSKGNGSKAYS